MDTDFTLTFIWIFAICFGIGIALFSAKKMNKDNKVKTKYDERQLKIRGDAFKYGFFATLISNGIIMALAASELERFLGVNAYFIPIFIGVVVQMTYSVFKDAYFGLNNQRRSYLIFMFFIGLINFASAIIATLNNELMIDGVFQAPFLNYLCGSLFVILGGELAIKSLIDKKA
jgi:hypothetical protein